MIQLRVPGTFEYRELVGRAVATASNVARAALIKRGKLQNADPEFLHEIESAVGEAFNNAVVHAYGQAPGDVTIIVEAQADRIEVQVLDEGDSFAPEAVPMPDLDDPPVSGMGIFIIRSFVDSVSYFPGRPNRLVMVKYYESTKPTGTLCEIVRAAPAEGE